ncbi:MAG: tyrosine-protein phosphatase, partial [Erysipelotrichaceae bacterium]|nr:tyrosine-protein phosphatase [Erysipelotrichaceae bacterium]
DEEFANFRMIDTAGIKENVLYRSSSPVNPKLNRNLEADEAIRDAEIKTVFNMADYQNGIKLYEDYENSYYSSCEVTALNMSTKLDSEEFGHRLAESYRFMIAHEGPYLIHCTEGKDRTGFASAIIECLMGAEADEVVSDYMKTFYNYYGVKLGSLVYNNIAERNIKKDLATAFHIETIFADVDLSVCAKEYLLEIGMSEEEIDLFKKRLSKE